MIFKIIFCAKKSVNCYLARILPNKTVYFYDNSFFFYTTDARMFHNQEPNQYINRTQKIVLRILKKHHESSFNGILTIRQQFKCSLTKSSEILARTIESTEEYMFRNFKMCLWAKRVSISFQGWATVLGGLSGRARGIRWSWAGKEEFDIYFCVFFGCRSLISGGETGHWDISLFPRILTLKSFGNSCEATRIPSLLY